MPAFAVVSRVVAAKLLLAAVIASAAFGIALSHEASAGALRPGSVTRPIPTDRPTRVLAVGDSVMLGAAGTIPAACGGCEVTVDAEVSRSTGTSVDAAVGHGTDWDVVVVLLAHNDGGSAGVYQPAFERMFDSFAEVPRIIVLTIHEARPYYAEVNAYLRSAADARPNVSILDWNAIVAADGSTVAGDGLHLTGHGAGVMAAEIAAAVERARGELAPTTTTAPPPTTTTSTTAVATTSSPATTDGTGPSDMPVRSGPTSVAAVPTIDSGLGSASERSDGHRPTWAPFVPVTVAIVLVAAAAVMVRRGPGPRRRSRPDGSDGAAELEGGGEVGSPGAEGGGRG